MNRLVYKLRSSALISDGKLTIISQLFHQLSHKDIEQISLRIPFEINLLKVSLEDKNFELNSFL